MKTPPISRPQLSAVSTTSTKLHSTTGTEHSHYIYLEQSMATLVPLVHSCASMDIQADMLGNPAKHSLVRLSAECLLREKLSPLPAPINELSTTGSCNTPEQEAEECTSIMLQPSEPYSERSKQENSARRVPNLTVQSTWGAINPNHGRTAGTLLIMLSHMHTVRGDE